MKEMLLLACEIDYLTMTLGDIDEYKIIMNGVWLF